MPYDLIIIGGGPAGMTAGIYAARQKLNTLLITKSFGGQMARKAVAIENYPGFEKISGLELIQKLEKHLKKRKIEILMDSVNEIKKNDGNFLVLTSSHKQFEGRAVIVASGADPRPLEVKGEKEFIGKGVSYCVACDGPLYADKEVAVVGGGNAGFEAALALARYAKKIYILEAGSQIKADEENQARAQKTGKIKVITGVLLKEIQGKDFVEAVIYQAKTSGEINNLKISGIFVEIGSQPATAFVKGLVDFNERDEIKVNPFSGETSTPGLFSAGDADDVPYKQIIIACGEGAKAAIAASAYLQKK
jgi:thioredoxin-disulfide reductase